MNDPLEVSEQYPSASAFEPLTSTIPVVDVAAVKQSAVKEDPFSPADATGVLPPTYPAASVPQTAPVRVSSRSRGLGGVSRGVRASWKSFVRADQALTQPMRGVGRLAQRQFSARLVEHRHQRIQEKEAVFRVLNFALKIAESLFQFGADTIDVDSAVVSVCSAYGLDDIEVDITSQSVIINYVSDVDVVNDATRAMSVVDVSKQENHYHHSELENERVAYTVMRVVRSWSENFAGLEGVYRLIGDITQRDLSIEKAERRLKQVMRNRKPYSPLILGLAYFLTATSLTLAVGGSWVASLISGLTFSVVSQVNQLIDRLKVPHFFSMMVGSLLITLMGLYLSDSHSILARIGVHVQAQYIVAAGLIVLLPTSRLISTVQDALTGFPLTAAGKFVSTGLSLLGIGIGLSLAVGLLQVFGLGSLEIHEGIFHPTNTFLNFLCMLVASVSIGVIYSARLRTLPWIALISTCGIWVTNAYVAILGEGTGRAYAVLGAFVVGMMSTYLAFRFQAPASMFYVPALTFLLPGLSLFRGMYLFTTQAAGGAGVPSMLTAATVIFGMAAGVVLGGFVMQFFMQKYVKSEKLETTPGTTMISVLDVR